MLFEEKYHILGNKYNWFGFDYFIGGIYEFSHKRISGTPTTNVVGWFDWRYRHGATITESPYYDGDPNETGWLTPLEDQTGCGSCWAFTASHTIADNCNLYYNDHLDFNLSETEILSCCTSVSPPYTPCGNCSGGSFQWALNWIKQENIHFENDCQPYYPPFIYSCNGPPPVCAGEESVGIEAWDIVPIFSGVDIIKTAIITEGPLASGIKEINHAMVLIGFNTGEVGDIVYEPEDPNVDPIILDENSPLIGQIYFVFKNSFGQNLSYNNPPYIRFAWNPDHPEEIATPCKLLGSIAVNTPFPPQQQWFDRDHDGYYWWGIGTKPVNCPGDADQEDCDDFDMYAGPYNHRPENGPLYECTPNPCVTEINLFEEITGYTYYTGIEHINKNIIIRDNATLEIQGELFLTPGVKIIVEAGGLLKLFSTNPDKPAKISSGCGELWKGIELWGDPTSSQDPENQGMIKIINGIIENAACGIMTGNPDYTPEGGGQGEPYPVYPSGGIIDASLAVFRNNKIDVRFYPYRDFDDETGDPIANVSIFQKCTFETTEELLNNADPEHHVRLDGVNEVVFKGCTFQNTRDNTASYPYRGTGIFSYNSQVKLEKINIPETNCLFDNLEYGIYGMYSGLGRTSLTLENGELSGNCKGIYLSGYTPQSPIIIQNCEFNINNNIGFTEAYGLYLNNCTGFDVRQNHFTGIQNLSDTYGVIVNNSGGANNYIYDNHFEYLTYGLQGLNVNRSSEWIIEGEVPVYVPTGLRFICNKFHEAECVNDLLINDNLSNPPVETGIAYYQKNASNITNPTQGPASNIFTPPPVNLTDDIFDINISTEVEGILYSYHTSSDPPGLRLEPYDVSNPDQVDYDEIFETFSENGSCPDTFYPEGDRSGLRASMNEANQKTDSLTNLLQFLIDEGSTYTLNSTVENSTSAQSYDVYQDLMGSSPYLSDTVIKTSIIKEDVLPNVMIRDIMVANPHSAKNEDLLVTLDNRIDPMPDSMWVEILQGMDTVGAKENLEGELAGWMQRKDLYFDALVRLFMTDTINSWSSDSLISLYQTDNRLSSKYRLLEYYLNYNDFTQASSTLQNIPFQFNLSDRQQDIHLKYTDLVGLLPQLYNDTLGPIISDSMQSINLLLLVDDETTYPGAWARNILIASDLLDYHEPIVCETTLKSSWRDRFYWTYTRPITSELKIFPNPAKDYIIAEYRKNDSNEEVILEMTDFKGKIVRSYYLPKIENQQLIPLSGLSGGIYFINLYKNKFLKGAYKVVVIR